MKRRAIAVSDLLETVAIIAIVAAVALAAGLWPAILAGGVACAYLAHAWDWGDAEVGVGQRVDEPKPSVPIVSERTYR